MLAQVKSALASGFSTAKFSQMCARNSHALRSIRTRGIPRMSERNSLQHSTQPAARQCDAVVCCTHVARLGFPCNSPMGISKPARTGQAVQRSATCELRSHYNARAQLWTLSTVEHAPAQQICGSARGELRGQSNSSLQDLGNLLARGQVS